ncbi:tRNA cyclic N6-threonylcarbamoyladenosine(37) synthase TcdA [Gallaecimonas pentaromativorans]|uniref:tRNA threonylcarbamoyladenosine dehydratase n=1 Tax=Gallaecimonas pentaromativorans TaxID=584787 RepID=A0A3N1PPI8_9GAMM|nr:tRNA cyclic N6-threonylcarbamoyladenosine(37) synthase TcdA [Gallaecimonas pentaromativorans]MED5523228.1 tRNA cyclic N6-threonylcarbamoyladenosine(37) synthase TcdA [Pseudomonadota bacterium]ROQ30423.1 tRNA A37 threonylcarbamoyladenosine dehydratase [Gallaecimonas pentaromativorans]
MSDYDTRFGGIIRLYGQSAANVLKHSHIFVAGIGGVGTWVAEALARSGVGAITLVDMDDVCTTNTNRQIHALTTTVGLPKTEVMAERIRLINPDCQVTAIDDFVTPENVAELLAAGFDYVIDATDSLGAKAAMIAHCKRNKIRIITMGGAGGQVDPTQVQVADLTKTIQDPLARKLKERLRRNYHFSKTRKFGVDCVFSSEALKYPKPDGTVCATKQADGSMRMDCASGFGASMVVTATFGLVAVAKVIEKLTGVKP